MILSEQELVALIDGILQPGGYGDLPRDLKNIVVEYSQQLKTVEKKTSKDVKRTEIGYYIDGVKLPYSMRDILGTVVNRDGIFFAVADMDEYIIGSRSKNIDKTIEVFKYIAPGKYTKINEERVSKTMSIRNTETSIWYKDLSEHKVTLSRYDVKTNRFHHYPMNIAGGDVDVNYEDDILVSKYILNKKIDLDDLYEKNRDEDSVSKKDWNRMNESTKIM
jgi:hypothetical protein